MKKFVLLLALILPINVWADYNQTPFIYEEYQTLVVAKRSENYTVVYFMREGQQKPVAMRYVNDEMQWYSNEDGFYLVWNDNSVAYRAIRFKVLAFMKEEVTTTDSGDWWGQGRIMTDLRMP
jgi:hypothetical protein